MLRGASLVEHTYLAQPTRNGEDRIFWKTDFAFKERMTLEELAHSWQQYSATCDDDVIKPSHRVTMPHVSQESINGFQPDTCSGVKAIGI